MEGGGATHSSGLKAESAVLVFDTLFPPLEFTFVLIIIIVNNIETIGSNFLSLLAVGLRGSLFVFIC